MANSLPGNKLNGKRLAFMALAFAALFCASSIRIYKDEKAQTQLLSAANETFEGLGRTSLTPKQYQLIHVATHGVLDVKEVEAGAIRLSAIRLADEYWATTAILAHELGHISKDEKQSRITFTYPGHYNHTFKVRLDGSSNAFLYEQLLLQKRLEEGELSPASFQSEFALLAQAYLTDEPQTDVTGDVESLRAELRAAQQQIAETRAQVETLKVQLAEAERLTFEKWALIGIAFLSALIALSSNVVAWRTDRRQKREAELVPLKRQEMERNIIQKDQQIVESARRIVAPSPQELRLYSSILPAHDSGWKKRWK
ncbi:MAG TPA: hypothetical protein VN282_12175 [Pyrinomonadaceae bacterium]|nr:hypothetical protein [Pyrinomonadaceae bacterium]